MIRPLLALFAALVVLYFAIPREKFQPEFLDKTQVDKTVSTENSSYAQQTNHMTPAPYSMGPVQGFQTPFQVNQYKAYLT